MTAFVRENLNRVKMRMALAAETCGRSHDKITLVAVSKTKSVDLIREALCAGQKDFGENYVQEFFVKHQELSEVNTNIQWHFIGHLQRNKVKDVVGKAHLIHTLDRISLAQAIDKQAAAKNLIQDCLIEVKVSSEASKLGCPENDLFAFMQNLNALKHVRVLGLMTIGSLTDDTNLTKSEFSRLCELRDEINLKSLYKNKLTELSMGMSHDFELAIACGATLIRIGTDIFGKREAHET